MNEEMLTRILTGIDGIRGDVSEIKTDIAVLKKDVSTLKTDMTEVKADVSNLKADVSNLKTDVSSLKTDMSDMQSELLKEMAILEGKVDDNEAKSETRDAALLKEMSHQRMELKYLKQKSAEHEIEIFKLHEMNQP